MLACLHTCVPSDQALEYKMLQVPDQMTCRVSAGYFGVEWAMGRKPTEFNAFDVELPKDTVIMKQKLCKNAILVQES